MPSNVLPARVLIVILCYNGVELTLACLQSLQKQTYPGADILIVDNNSSDDTVAEVRKHFPAVAVVENGRNLGYAAGNNVGLRYAQAHGYDYVLLLNNDTEVDANFLHPLIERCTQDPTIAVVGPKIYYHHEPNRIWSAGGVIDWKHGNTYMIGLDAEDQGQFDAEKEVDFVTGCALLVRTAVLEKSGLIDERFGMYFEETEWCVRIRRSGGRIVYVPQSRLWHKIRTDKQDWSPRITYYMARNRLLFMRLVHAPWQSWLHAVIVQDLRTWLSWRIRPKWKNRAEQRAAMRLAWRDFLIGRFGMMG